MARTRSEEYEDKRQHILTQAAALFAEHGFAGTSMAALAARCGVSKPLLYHYYASKEALLFDLIDAYIAHFAATVIEAAEAPGNPEERLRQSVRSLMEICIADRDRHITMLNELQRLPPAQQAPLIAAQRRVVAAIGDMVLAINPAFAATKVPLAFSLLGSINWAYRWFHAVGGMTPRDYADLACDVFLSGVRPS